MTPIAFTESLTIMFTLGRYEDATSGDQPAKKPNTGPNTPPTQA